MDGGGGGGSSYLFFPHLYKKISARICSKPAKITKISFPNYE